MAPRVLGKLFSQRARAVVISLRDSYKHLLKLVRSLLGVEADHADRGPLIEDGRQDRAVADERQLDVVFSTLVEEHGELLLAEKPSHLASCSIATGHEGRDRLHVEVFGASRLRHHMPLFVDEHIALGIGKAQELLQDGIDLVNVVLVEDQTLFSDIITVGNNSPPPELVSASSPIEVELGRKLEFQIRNTPV